jgi:hypothetical protein
MIVRFLFVMVIVPFLRAWPRLFIWLEEQVRRARGE